MNPEPGQDGWRILMAKKQRGEIKRYRRPPTQEE